MIFKKKKPSRVPSRITNVSASVKSFAVRELQQPLLKKRVESTANVSHPVLKKNFTEAKVSRSPTHSPTKRPITQRSNTVIQADHMEILQSLETDKDVHKTLDSNQVDGQSIVV